MVLEKAGNRLPLVRLISAVYMSGNPVQHLRTKHIEIDIHFVREKVALGQVWVLHVPCTTQFADIFTKGLPLLHFVIFDPVSTLSSLPLILRGMLDYYLALKLSSPSRIVIGLVGL